MDRFFGEFNKAELACVCVLEDSIKKKRNRIISLYAVIYAKQMRFKKLRIKHKATTPK